MNFYFSHLHFALLDSNRPPAVGLNFLSQHLNVRGDRAII